MNSDAVSLFSIATGPRGSHKTLVMTSIVCERMVKAWIRNTFLGKNDKVFTNYPVGFWYHPPGLTPVYLTSNPLNMNAMLTFDKELDNCWAFIDEIDLWADRQEWQSVTQKLLSAVFQQIRKRKMNLMATIQDFKWLNSRLQFQTDIVIKCREAAFTPWGKDNGVGLGEVSFLTWLDKSGVMTGYTYEESGQYYSNMFHGKDFWNCYDTDYQFDPLLSKTKYKLKVPVREITIGGDNKPLEADNINMQSGEKNPDEVLLSQVLSEYKEKGILVIPTTDIWDEAESRSGHKMNKTYLGRYLRKCNVEKTVKTGVTHYFLGNAVV